MKLYDFKAHNTKHIKLDELEAYIHESYKILWLKKVSVSLFRFLKNFNSLKYLP